MKIVGQELVLVLFTVLLYLKVGECISCLQCQDIADPSQCETARQCPEDHEFCLSIWLTIQNNGGTYCKCGNYLLTCYIESVMSLTSYQLQYNLGCREMKLCKFQECAKDAYGTGNNSTSAPGDNSTAAASDSIVRRANGLSICLECCYENNCNIEGCGYKFKSTNTKCYVCTNVHEGGPDCTNTVSCDLTTDTCSVTLTRHSTYPNAFDLGCSNKRQCELLLSLPGASKDPNAKCCGKSLCNGNPHFNPSNQTSVMTHTCAPNIASPPTQSTTEQTTSTTAASSTTPITTTSTTTPTTTSMPTTTPTTTTTTSMPTTTPTTTTTTSMPTTTPTTTTTTAMPTTTPTKTTTTSMPTTTPTTTTTTSMPTTTPTTTTTTPMPTTTTTPTTTTPITTPTTTTIPTTPEQTTTTTAAPPTTPMSTTTTTSMPTTTPTTTSIPTTTTTPMPTTTTTPTTTPTTTTIPTTPAATTDPPPKTLPPVTKQCHACNGPVFLCEQVYAPTACDPPNNYCINKITNYKDGTRDVVRTCGNFDTCYRDWFQGSSDNDRCRQFNQDNEQRLDFQCTFCCVEDLCNDRLHPPNDALYRPV